MGEERGNLVFRGRSGMLRQHGQRPGDVRGAGEFPEWSRVQGDGRERSWRKGWEHKLKN